MYNPRIEDEHIRRLFRLKEGFKAMGESITMVGLIKEALEAYLPNKEAELRRKTDELSRENNNGR